MPTPRTNHSQRKPQSRPSASNTRTARSGAVRDSAPAASSAPHAQGRPSGGNVSTRPASAGRSLRSSAKIDRIREQGHASLREEKAAAQVQPAMKQIQRSAKHRTLETADGTATRRPSAAHAQPVRRQARPTGAPKTVKRDRTNRGPSRTAQGVPVARARAQQAPHPRPQAAQGQSRGRRRQPAPSAVGSATLAGGIWTKDGGKSNGGMPPRSSRKAPLGGAGGNRRGSRFGAKAKVLAALLVAVLAIGGIDSLLNADRIYSGITIGDVDVSGKTRAEATQLVSAEYSSRVGANSIVFFTSSEAMENPQESDDDATVDEQISYEESLSDRTQWTVNASAVEASFDVDALVEQAYQIGRGDGGIIGRLQAQLQGRSVEAICSFNESLIEQLSDETTAVMGEKRVNYGIEMVDSVASVTEGHDGNEVTQDWLREKINECLLGVQETSSCLLETTYLPLQIDREEAEDAANEVNASIASGANFVYEDQTWSASREDLASWITASIVQNGSKWELKPCFDEATAKNALLASLHSNINRDNIAVSFAKSESGEISVSSNATGSVPAASDAVKSMNETFFVAESRTSAPSITLASAEIASTLSFEDARDFGLIGEISSFTTQYSSGNEARVNNIHTAASLLNNSIASADNGTWSFNGIAGEASEDKGYQAAGAIVGGEHTDAIGGGICQVATTVFNAVYDAGYPITERHNHSLYISSYPDGRDAAIAYPDYDLVWENDTTSDVLLVMSYTDSSVTATLWGINPGYQVSTETGEWQKGEEYTTKYKTDSSVASGTQYVETTGVNGRSITVVRTVEDAQGNLLHEDTFDSNYSPKNEVIVKGTA